MLTAGAVEHLRQTVQGLRAEYQIDKRRPLTDRLTLLACHATTDAIISSGRFCFHVRQRPNWEKTFSWAFSRIEQVLSSKTSASSGRSVCSRP